MSIKAKIRSLIAAIINEPKQKVFVTVNSVKYTDSFVGKVSLITGGSRGIGYSVAEKLVESGSSVIITGRDENHLASAVDSLGNQSKYIVYDNENIKGIADFVNKCYSIYGRIDNIVLNAGISLHEGDFLNVCTDGFERQFTTNLESPYFLLKSFITRAIETESMLNVVIVSSETSGKSNDLPYGLTKVALNSMIGGFARRVIRKGIRINGVAPGVTLTQMTSSNVSDDNVQYESPIGRYILPEEISNIVVFLLSDASLCINGEVLFCDNGNHLKINGFDNNYAL